MSLTLSFPLRLRRRLGLAWLLLALLLAPLLGRMHQVLHVPGIGQGGGLSAPGDAHPQAEAGPGSAGQQTLDMLHTLFAGHSGVDCQVLDQHTQLGAGCSTFAVGLPTLPQAAPLGVPLAAPNARRTAAFHARAPPLSI